jgi:tRNA threonylcarbamoyladenosine biosynthesis protein TsaE
MRSVVGGERVIASLEELEDWGGEFVELLRPGMIVGISGDLGAGKTSFCKVLLRGMGYEGEVTSPTFALHHRYEAPWGVVDHFDLYRVEVWDGDFWTFFGEAVEEAELALVEWPERYPYEFPRGRLCAVKIELMGGGERRYSWSLR